MEVNIKVLRTYFITYKNPSEGLEIARYLISIGEQVYFPDRLLKSLSNDNWEGFKCNTFYGPDGDDIWCLSVYKNYNLKSITWTKFQRVIKLKRIQKKYEL